MQQKLNQVNQFSGGMIKDLHPIMMSNTAFTDCLNGTLITFNGNEFALQNDMGNYAFKYGSLSNGFVPVGIKEFGGILYIVSYNPVSNRVEIGSFPSQKTIFNAADSNTQSTLEPLKLEHDVNFYSTLTNKSVIKIFNKEDTFFLNPGDKYYLSLKGDPYKSWEALNGLLNWQHLTPYVLTNENKLYSIEGYIEISAEPETLNREAYKTVTWEIPGWIAAKFDINVMQEFNVYADSNSSKIVQKDNEIYSIPSGNYKIQSIWNLNNYPSSFKEYLSKNLFYVVHSEPDVTNLTKDDIEGAIPKPEPETEAKTLKNTTYNDFQTVYYDYYDFDVNQNLDVKKSNKYVVPVLRVEVGKDVNGNPIYKYIVYNQFNTEINTNITKIEKDKISIGKETFKWTVSEDSFVLTYDVNSYPGINLRINFERPFADEDLIEYDENRSSSDGTITKVFKKGIDVDDINYHGINIKSFLFTSLNDYRLYKYSKDGSNEYTILSNTTNKTVDRYGIKHTSGTITVANTFDKEDYYKLTAEFYFTDDNGSEISVKPAESFDIVISEILNEWYNSVNLYHEKIKNEGIVNALMDFITIENTPTLVPIESDIRGFSSFLTQPFSIDKGDKQSDVEMLGELLAEKTQNKAWIANNFGFPFVNVGYTERQSGTVNVYDGTSFALFEQGKIKIKLPKNQYGYVGRLWRFLNPKEIKNAQIIDSKKIPYTVEIKGDKNNDYYLNNDNLSLQFYMKNNIEMTLSSRPITKSIPQTTKSILNYLDDTWKNKVGLNKNFGWIKGELVIAKLKGDDGIGFGFRPYTDYVYFTFENGNLKVWSTPQVLEETWNTSEWPVKTFNSVFDDLDYFDNDGDYIGPSHMAQKVEWFIADDDTPKKSKARWAYYTTKAQSKAPIMFPVTLWNNRETQTRILSERFGRSFIEINRRYTAFYLPGERPFVIYPDGSAVTDDNIKRGLAKTKSQAFYTLFAILWYCKVGLGVKQSTIYYPSISTKYTKTNPKTFKGINLGLKFEYNYSISDSYTELNSLNNYEDYFTININKELSVPEDEEVYKIIQSYAFNTSEKSAAAMLDKQLEPEITKSGTLVLDSSVNDCEEIDLSSIIKDWNITSSKLTYEEKIEDNRVRLRSGDNWYIPVAQESFKTVK